jgi:hypothetical protein
MSPWRSKHHFVLCDGLMIQFFTEFSPRSNESCVELAGLHGFDLWKRQHGSRDELSVWLLLPESAKRFRDNTVPRNTLHKAYSKGASLAASHAFSATDGLLSFLKNAACIVKE